MIIRTLQAAVSPLNIVLLPYLSDVSSNHSSQKMQSNLKDISQMILTLPIILCSMLYYFSSDLILIWFNEKYIDIISDLIYVIPAICCYMLYIIISGVLNGLHKKPYVNYICFCSFITMSLYLFLNFSNITYYVIINSLVFSLYIMGIISLILFFYFFENNISIKEIFKILLVMILYICSNVYSLELLKTLNTGNIIYYKLIVSFSLLFLILIYLNKREYRWVEKIFSIFNKDL